MLCRYTPAAKDNKTHKDVSYPQGFLDCTFGEVTMEAENSESEETSRVETTLFLLMSVDGKITSGESDGLDPDQDWKRIQGAREGLYQYYELEQRTDLYSLNTGRVLAKTGINAQKEVPQKCSVSFIVIDRRPHLNEQGLAYLSRWLKHLYIVTDNKAHPGFALSHTLENMEMIYYAEGVDLSDLLMRLKEVYGIDRLTVQCGGTLNAMLIRQRLIDHISIVVAPLLVGGRTTLSLVDGLSFQSQEELINLKALKLVGCTRLKESYIHLEYDVINETVVTAVRMHLS